MPDGHIIVFDENLKASTIVEPLYFVVERTLTAREQPLLYHDHLPAHLRVKNAKRDGLIYALRLDTLDHPIIKPDMTPARLYELYVWLRDRGQLPGSS